jgi:hypothetical protein
VGKQVFLFPNHSRRNGAFPRLSSCFAYVRSRDSGKGARLGVPKGKNSTRRLAEFQFTISMAILAISIGESRAACLRHFQTKASARLHVRPRAPPSTPPSTASTPPSASLAHPSDNRPRSPVRSDSLLACETFFSFNLNGASPPARPRERERERGRERLPRERRWQLAPRISNFRRL